MTIRFTTSILTLLLAVSIPAIAESKHPWYVDYDRAVNKINHGKFAVAEEILLDLLERKALPQPNVPTYGMWSTDYTPYYYLGEAQRQMGKEEVALRAYRAADRFGVARRDEVKSLTLDDVLLSRVTRLETTTPPPVQP